MTAEKHPPPGTKPAPNRSRIPAVDPRHTLLLADFDLLIGRRALLPALASDFGLGLKTVYRWREAGFPLWVHALRDLLRSLDVDEWPDALGALRAARLRAMGRPSRTLAATATSPAATRSRRAQA